MEPYTAAEVTAAQDQIYAYTIAEFERAERQVTRRLWFMAFKFFFTVMMVASFPVIAYLIWMRVQSG